MFIYATYDKVAKKVRDYFISETNEEAIRNAMIVFRNMYPLKDIEIFKVGKVEMNEPKVEEMEKELIPWNIYKLPETKAENFKNVGIDVDFDKNSEQKIEE